MRDRFERADATVGLRRREAERCAGRNCRLARMFEDDEELPVPRTGAAQARLTSGISGERSESAACRG